MILCAINLIFSREIILTIGRPMTSECLKGVPGGDHLLYLLNPKKNRMNLRKAYLVVGVELAKTIREH